MILFLAILLGLIQALTEFLPISSSAHLILARGVLDFDYVDGLTFDVALHVGTLLALVVYFWRDIVALARAFAGTFRKPDFGGNAEQRLVWFMLAACVPAGIVGFFFEEVIEIYFRNPLVIVITLILGGILFLVVEDRTRHDRGMDQMKLRHAIWIGLAQTLALIPGVSRSGITIATGMIVGLRRHEAARFSFIMVIPLLAGAGAKKALDLAGHTLVEGELTVLIAGIVSSAIAGWLVIRFLLDFLRKRGLGIFAWYRFVLAAAVAGYLIVVG